MSTIILIATIFVGSLDGRLPYGAPKQSDVIAAREGYVVGFNDKTHCPDWCYEQLNAANLQGGKVKRSNDFILDIRPVAAVGASKSPRYHLTFCYCLKPSGTI